MALTDAFPGASGLVDTVELRKDLNGLILRDTSGAARAGVFPRSTAALVTSRASMGVDVAAFEAAFVRGGGPLFTANDGTVTVTLAAAPASNSRIDVVYAKQNESAAPFADANNTPTIGVASGTAAASPTAPTVPTGALPLAQVLIPSTATTTQSSGVVITQVYPYTAATGGLLLVRNQAERDSATWGDGTTVYRLDTKAREVRDTGTWLSFDSVPQTYTPALSGPTTIGVGAGGTITGEYVRVGRLVHVRVAVLFGTPLNITAGSIKLSLPFTSAALANGQRIQGQYYYPPIGTMDAFLYLSPVGVSTPTVVVLSNGTTNAYADLNMGSAAGAGVPTSAGSYGVADNSNLLFQGSYYI